MDWENIFFKKECLDREDKNILTDEIIKLRKKYNNFKINGSFIQSDENTKIIETNNCIYGCNAGIARFAIIDNKYITPCISIKKVKSSIKINTSILKTIKAVKDKCIIIRNEYKKLNCKGCKYKNNCDPPLCDINL